MHICPVKVYKFVKDDMLAFKEFHKHEPLYKY